MYIKLVDFLCFRRARIEIERDPRIEMTTEKEVRKTVVIETDLIGIGTKIEMPIATSLRVQADATKAAIVQVEGMVEVVTTRVRRKFQKMTLKFLLTISLLTAI